MLFCGPFFQSAKWMTAKLQSSTAYLTVHGSDALIRIETGGIELSMCQRIAVFGWLWDQEKGIIPK
jgi:hypothetical protein